MTYEQRIRQELERVAGTEEWIRLHCNPEDTEAFEVGLVERVSRETVVLHTIDTNGQDGGSRSVAIESITGVTVGGFYLEALKTLRDRLASSVRVSPEGDGHEGMLRAALDAGLVVSIRAPDETVQGFVREVGEGWASIAVVDEEEGGDDGVRFLELEEVERVFVGGHDEQRLAALFRARQIRDSIG